MMREPSAPAFDYAVLEPLTTPEEQVIVLLLDALRRLADAGELDAACRVAGKRASSCGEAMRRANVVSTRCSIASPAGSNQWSGKKSANDPSAPWRAIAARRCGVADKGQDTGELAKHVRHVYL